MYSDLINVIKKTPDVYETTGVAFWDDAHISKSMLQAHLAPENDRASRNHAFIIKSVDWIDSLETMGKELLDLGCGPGLYAEAFAHKDYRVTGVDFSRCSIDYATYSAEQSKLDIEYHYQDYLSIDYRNKFDILTLIYCDFGVLSTDSRRNLLKKIYSALKPGGVFVFDVWHPNQYASFYDAIDASYEDSGFWRSEPYICIKRDKRYEDNHFLEQYIVITENDCMSYNIWNHAFTPEELTADLQDAGFSSMKMYGDVQGKPLDKDDKTICVVGKK
jgi:2-polyprenyl-3-methyl-5-hydroxy-6-metoxy-1,4-benzoquinol methylase